MTAPPIGIKILLRCIKSPIHFLIVTDTDLFKMFFLYIVVVVVVCV